jgi:hypothetical protein
MTSATPSRKPAWVALAIAALVVASLAIPAVRSAVFRALESLRIQKVQAVNVNFSPFVDASSNPSLHQMVSQMISDKVQVDVNEDDRTVPDSAAARQVAGFNVLLLSARKDAPKLIVGGAHKLEMTIDRSRLQAIATEAGHPDLVLPQSLDGAHVGVQIPRSVNLQYGTCPGPSTAASAIASNITGPTPTTTEYSDCVRLREGPNPVVNTPADLNLPELAQIALETAGMAPKQANDFLQTVDWKATLSLSVPRFLRSYQVVKVNGARGTLLTMAGRRGPGYALIWTNNGIDYSLSGFGDSSQAVELADSLK